MASDFRALAQDALSLDPSDRLRLAAELIDSVEGAQDPAWVEAWRTELQLRSANAGKREAQGEARGSDWAEVRGRLLRDLAKR